VFVGGTPTWGGVGTVGGALVGAFTVGFIESGIIAVGLTGFWTQFAYGAVVILSLVGHRVVQGAHRRR
jgi:simple sugar transport system permease protein